MKILFDIETDNLKDDLTKIHCISTINIDTMAEFFYTDEVGLELPVGMKVSGTVKDGAKFLAMADEVIGHNIINFDIPVLEKITGVSVETAKYDTYLAACVLFPNQKSNSLGAWAEELKTPMSKVKIKDFSKLTPELISRCRSDILINLKLYQHLVKKSEHWDNFPIVMDLEQQVAKIHAKQEEHGVRFDVEDAIALLDKLKMGIAGLREEITGDAPPGVRLFGKSIKFYEELKGGVKHGADVDYWDLKEPFKKDGDWKASVKDYFYDDVKYVGGPCTRLSFPRLNLDSPQQVHKFLYSLGWKPTQWNTKIDWDGSKVKTSPKLTEDSYKSLPEGIGKKMSLLAVMSHRRRFLANQKDNTKGALNTVREDGTVSAQAQTCGTPTARYRHRGTVCNIPRPSTLYGERIRGLFTVPRESLMVGVDLSGIEARMMAHYAYEYDGGPELKELVLEGDFHQHNADTWGVERNDAKSGLYALMYGCGNGKLATTLGKPAKQGKELVKKFWDSNPALESLIENLQLKYHAEGCLTGLDGRVMEIREERKLLNSLLQGGAAIVFKRWMIECDRMITVEGWNARQVIAMHDELQFQFNSLNTDNAERFGSRVCDCATRVGKDLKLNVPIEADCKVGDNWSDTH